MSDSIGTYAGLIWNFFNDNGPASANKIATETGLSKNELQRALGWLACENKLTFTTKGRTESISLR
ncbi:MAG: winged helix-turn-helix domain-containing protein [Methyloprofundus sp.]|nr:winged helix-turn-helix domain-containing protein [Methyloprofundus sp.]